MELKHLFRNGKKEIRWKQSFGQVVKPKGEEIVEPEQQRLQVTGAEAPGLPPFLFPLGLSCRWVSSILPYARSTIPPISSDQLIRTTCPRSEELNLFGKQLASYSHKTMTWMSYLNLLLFRFVALLIVIDKCL